LPPKVSGTWIGFALDACPTREKETSGIFQLIFRRAKTNLEFSFSPRRQPNPVDEIIWVSPNHLKEGDHSAADIIDAFQFDGWLVEENRAHAKTWFEIASMGRKE